MEKLIEKCFTPKKTDVLYDIVRDSFVQLMDHGTDYFGFRDLNKDGKNFEYESNEIVFIRTGFCRAKESCIPTQWMDGPEYAFFKGIILPLDVAIKLSHYKPEQLEYKS